MSNPLSVAPMMDLSDRHFRYFMRLITRHTLLYTEMITTAAILHGHKDKLLDFSPLEHPIVLQLGGDNPQDLAECARIGEDWGYNMINLNVGCPSDRVQKGNFGACLMATPEIVAKGVEAIKKVVNIPVTIKHRIGIDEYDSYEYLANFVTTIAEAGCTHFIVHARKAWLQGLSPKENREIPPLRYDYVHRLKRQYPHLTIDINGGITTLSQAERELRLVDGVMIGRAAYDNPFLFATVDRDFYHDITPPPTRWEIVEKMLPYIDTWVAKGYKVHTITRHMLQLFSGQPGSRLWKRYLSSRTHLPDATSNVLVEAVAELKI